MRDFIKQIVEQFIVSYYPESNNVWIGGSTVYGNITKESDIDLLIIDGTKSSRLECHHFLGWKIEAFIYSPSSLEFQFQIAKYRGIPTIIKLCAEGLPLRDKLGAGKKLQEEALLLYEQGPQPWEEGKLNETRYQITDFLSDFKSSEDFGESLFILNKIINLMAELILRANGKWIGEGKWLARNLKAYDKDMYEKIIDYTKIYMKTNDKNELISLVKSILNNYGGELFCGYRGVLL
ncbi:nucleotidyltransferase domain-containing protein [Aquibacillus rhizosphaerae]|uniref:Nucleotidyltransferase domain-containing protein n=1 Tax=Aquibacillus rhizosphaerae TaxID=3051431 RepID=A0ABT7L9I7_9BACI|nr:nucleotidyltransferase domain-containing protein [Aquibacillus sp. LR5S19]MDL4842531.1 nucleotidyltransferase domain-containing protein [Aquibacillus sp. LR5S19]